MRTLFIGSLLLIPLALQSFTGSECDVQNQLIAELNSGSSGLPEVLTEAGKHQLVLVGESHDNWEDSFYEILIRQRTGSKQCLFLEQSEAVYQNYLQSCNETESLAITPNASSRKEEEIRCPNRSESITLARAQSAAVAIDAGWKVFAVDAFSLLSRNNVCPIQGDTLSWMRCRNRYMAERVQMLLASECNGGILINGTGHLSSRWIGREETMQSLLAARGIVPYKIGLLLPKDVKEGVFSCSDIEPVRISSGQISEKASGLMRSLTSEGDILADIDAYVIHPSTLQGEAFRLEIGSRGSNTTSGKANLHGPAVQ